VGQASISADSKLTCRYNIDIGSCWGQADFGDPSLPESSSVLGMMKMKIWSLIQWPYSVLCACSLGSTLLKIRRSTKIGASAENATQKLSTDILS
jgi:hypothetical protein